MTTLTFLNDETKAYLDNLTPIREMGSETICDCSTCGKGLTCADVDDIPSADFHEDYPDCLDCIVKRKNARTIAVLEAHGAIRKDEEDETGPCAGCGSKTNFMSCEMDCGGFECEDCANRETHVCRRCETEDDSEEEEETEEQVKARLRASVAYWEEQLKLGTTSVEYGKPRYEKEEDCDTCGYTHPPCPDSDCPTGEELKTYKKWQE